MAWYAVSYDLRKEYSAEAWKKVGDALRTAADWCTPLYSFWIIQSNLSPAQIIAELLRVGAIDDNDGIVVLEVTMRGDFRRVSDAEHVVEWMRSHIDRF
jgi:hypothetical protein